MPVTIRNSVRSRRLVLAALVVAGAALAGAPAAQAQLDPLLFLKRVPPTVVVVVDTSLRMLDDGQGNYYDPRLFTSNGDLMHQELGVPTGVTYRRIYRNFRPAIAPTRFEADTIQAVKSTDGGAFATFYNVTRLQVAKQGLALAIADNSVLDAAAKPVDESTLKTVRWGLLKLRQANPAWAVVCDKPVHLTDGGELAEFNDANFCAGVGGDNSFGTWAPTVTAANFSQANAASALLVAPRANTADCVYNTVTKGVADATPITCVGTPNSVAVGLIPAGRDDIAYEDRPLALALKDALAQVTAAQTADATCSGCRNTVVVLVTGGRDDGDAAYLAANDAQTEAAKFLNVNGKRVPIYVIAVKPKEADEASLQGIADASGGRYFKVTTANEVARAVNLAVQAGFSHPANFNAGQPSEFLPVSPVVGTVNLDNAKDATGAALPDSVVFTPAGTKVPQRSNVTFTAGFVLGGAAAGGTSGPGFDGRLRAFRTFQPVADATKPNGYKYVKDGTRLWPADAGRPETAGIARTPADPAKRNIYTVVPGNGSLVPFDAAHLAQFGAHVASSDAERLAIVDLVRSQPLGAFIGSTPAVMDPPSIDPPPDDDYGHPDGGDTYAGSHTGRRSIIWVGANDGMLHAFDARTGYEVWAFIPFNLLPKLRTLLDGQPVEQFDYFVDSSPKIAEVKLDGKWRTLLVFGQGPGGTFYQAFDVTEAGMGAGDADSDDWQAVLSSFDQGDRVKFLWAFPSYGSFDTAYTGSFHVTDGTVGNRAKFYGELKATSTAAEKTVGYTWSDPAVGPLNADRSKTVVIAGSGYFPGVEGSLPGRAGAVAGRVLYLLDAATGKPVGNAAGPCSAANGAQGCFDVGMEASRPRKNAIQADPTAAGLAGDYVVTKVYVGDIDGRFHKLSVTGDGQISKVWSYDAVQPIYASSALMTVGSTGQYVFFATGSDLLPTSPAITSGGDAQYFLLGLQDLGASAGLKFSYGVPAAAGNGNGNNGGGAGILERPSTSPSVAGDIVFFTTTSESVAASCGGFTGNLYAFTFLGAAAYDSNATGAVEKGESPKVKSVLGRATAPFIVDQHLYFATSGNGSATVEGFGDPQDFNNGVGQVGVRILSWRELR